MHIAKWVAAVAVLLTAASAANADIPPVAYNTDPGFQRAYRAERLASRLLPVSLVASLVWILFARNTTAKRVGWAFVVALLFWYGWGVHYLNPAPRVHHIGGVLRREWVGLENKPHQPPPNGVNFFTNHRPDLLLKITWGEAALLGLLGSAVVCFGGLGVIRLAVRRASQTGSE